ncbi:MAG: NAD-dependent epimerase/dehydratase family protein [Deltaproteobacteria bacterium]
MSSRRPSPKRAARGEALRARERSGRQPLGARSIAITGAYGYLGRALIERFEASPWVERILALDLKPPPGALRKTRFVPIDLTRPRADQAIAEALSANEVDTLVHLALFYNPIHNAAYAHEVEAIGTLQLLDAATSAGVGAVATISTTALYGAHADNPAYLTEDRPLRPAPHSRFLADKLEVERQLGLFREQRPLARVAVLRLASMLGAQVKNPATRLLGRPLVPVLLGCDPLMQFLHEEDAVRALMLAVERRASGLFNVAPPGPLPLSSILRLLGRTPLPLPPPVARAAMSTLWTLLGLGTAPSWLDYLRYVWVADGSKAERELGLVYTHSCREVVASFGRGLATLAPAAVGVA